MNELRGALEYFACSILRCGKIPKHIAIMLDGSRRYAKKMNIHRDEGQAKGVDTLANTMQWCLDLGVEELTVYVFSTENFKRSDEEVDYLKSLAIEKFQRLVEEEDVFNRNEVNIRVIGNLSMLPGKLLKLVAQATVMTRKNNRVRFNMAIAYGAKDDMTKAVQTVASAVADGLLLPEDVSPGLLGAVMATEDSIPLDLLIRTSGETRISDFLLWQCANSVIYFAPVLWPEFSLWNLLTAIFQYQRAHPIMPIVQPLSSRAKAFISKLYEDRYQALAAHA